MHRPNNDGFGKASIWTARSPDLRHWGGLRCILRPREGVPFEGTKIGGGGPSVLTRRGWLQIYHGKGSDGAYALFSAILDRDDPSVVLARGSEPVLKPEAEYETSGFFPNVVFTNGLTHPEAGRRRHAAGRGRAADLLRRLRRGHLPGGGDRGRTAGGGGVSGGHAGGNRAADAAAA